MEIEKNLIRQTLEWSQKECYIDRLTLASMDDIIPSLYVVWL